MPPEIRETMKKNHKTSHGCFQGKRFSCDPPRSKRFSAHTIKPKHADGKKHANTDYKAVGAINNDKLSVEGECCGRIMQQEPYYFLKTASPNLLKELRNQTDPFRGSFYPVNQKQFFPTHWFPQIPLQILPQNYPMDYGLQDFQYFVVIDFEATCDKEKHVHPQEIIEFPSVLVNSRTGELEDCFQIYVRPTHNQQLTEFCKELTGIKQDQVDKGVLLSEALLMHDKWLEDKGIKHTNFAIVTWSNWDCEVMLDSECRFKKIKKPAYFNSWINLKIPFGQVFGGRRCKLKEAVELSGLSWEGQLHCGLDDAKNTARLLTHLMHRGFKFSITDTIAWQPAYKPDIRQQQQQQIPTSEYGLSYPSFLTLFPFQTLVAVNPSKEPHVYSYCGNWTAHRAAVCPFIQRAFSYASDSPYAK